MTNQAKVKKHYIDLEESIIVIGYNIKKEEAQDGIRKHAIKDWGKFNKDDVEDIIPIYKLVSTEVDYDITFEWETKPVNEGDRIIGWIFRI